MKEIQLQKLIVEWINYNGGYVHRSNTGKFILAGKGGRQRFFVAGMKGQADITGCWRDGRFLAVEVKIGYSQPSEAQLQFLEEVTNRGGIAFVTYNLDTVIEILDAKR